MTISTKFSDQFIVNWSISRTNENWIWGSFLLNIDGVIVGDPTDLGVDLMGCRNWVEEFLEVKVDRYEENLFDLDKTELFRSLAKSVLFFGDSDEVEEVYHDTLARFHLTQVGMSSFDQFVLLLVQDQVGNSRFVWWTKGKEIQDAYFKVGKIESEFSRFLTEFKPFETSRLRKKKE